MAPESMVHALEIIHDLLVVGGYLIDIHPSADAPEIAVLDGDRRSFAGYLQEKDNFIEYIQANQALTTAIQAEWYELESQNTFNFMIYSDGVDEFKNYLAENWEDAYLENDTIDRIEELTNLAPGSKLVSKEIIRIARLRAL